MDRRATKELQTSRSRPQQKPPLPLPAKKSKRLAGFSTMFNVARALTYAMVACWALICMGISLHFYVYLAASDLTRFVPLALAVSIISLVLMLTLLGLTFLGDRNPIPTHAELGSLALVGVLWLALGAFLATSDAESADVECFASPSDFTPVELSNFSTETYHAQYRVLEAFALFSAILMWAFFIVLLALALRKPRKVWYSPVTSVPWFSSSAPTRHRASNQPVTRSRSRPRKDIAGLPDPVTHRGRSRSRSRQQPLHEKTRDTIRIRELELTRGKRKPFEWGRRHALFTPQPQRVVKAHIADRNIDKFKRDVSPRR